MASTKPIDSRTRLSLRGRLALGLAMTGLATALLIDASPAHGQAQRARDNLRQSIDQGTPGTTQQQPAQQQPAKPAPVAKPEQTKPAATKTDAAKTDAAKTTAPTKAPFPYVWATAWHVLPETTTDESGYFSLNEGNDGAIYVGTAAYGRNAYLVRFEPGTFKQSIAVDAHKVLGLPLTPTGYAAQAKFHTRNFTGPSGKIYIGTKQGYPTADDKAKNIEYPGGYAMIHDPATGQTKSLGMPMAGQGIADTIADESRDLVYIVTCEDQHWFTYNLKTEKFTELDPQIRLLHYATTLTDNRGVAHVINKDSTLISWNPDTGKFDSNVLVVDSRVNAGDTDPRLYNAEDMKKFGPPTWVVTPDGKTAYLVVMNRPNLYKIDLTKTNPKADKAKPGAGRLVAQDLGPLIKGKGFDSRSALAIGPDGHVYALGRINNETGFGDGYLHHLLRYNTKLNMPEDLGVLAVKNPDFYGLPLSRKQAVDPETGKARPWTHGYHVLPDGTLTPFYNHMALIAAKDGTLYATIIYPYTLLRIEGIKAK